MKMRKSRLRAVAVLFVAVFMMSGCAALQGGGRQQFAVRVSQGADPVLKGYRRYVAADTTLNEDEKRMRLGLADDLEHYKGERGRRGGN